jgi:hypothetical protein
MSPLWSSKGFISSLLLLKWASGAKNSPLSDSHGASSSLPLLVYERTIFFTLYLTPVCFLGKKVKLHAHRAGLPGDKISFFIMPLDPAYKAVLAGHLPAKKDRKRLNEIPCQFGLAFFHRIR